MSTPPPRAVPAWSAAGLTFAAPVLTWWLTSHRRSQFPDHDWGPFRVPLWIEHAALVVAVAVAVLGVVGIVVPRARRARGRMGLLPLACLMLAGVVAAAGWRVMTAGVTGANIGGAMVFFTAPLVIGALLVGAVLVESRARRGSLRFVPLRVLAAGATTFALVAAPIVLQGRIDNRGHLRDGQIAAAHPGDSRAAVRSALGRSGEEVDWFFPPVPRGQRCDYYFDREAQFQVCYADDRVTTVLRSTDPYTGG